MLQNENVQFSILEKLLIHNGLEEIEMAIYQERG
jgi:hypothetical protein